MEEAGGLFIYKIISTRVHAKGWGIFCCSLEPMAWGFLLPVRLAWLAAPSGLFVTVATVLHLGKRNQLQRLELAFSPAE